MIDQSNPANFTVSPFFDIIEQYNMISSPRE